MNHSYFTVTHRSDHKQLDTSQLLSQVLNLRDTDREHRAKVCVLAPQIYILIKLYTARSIKKVITIFRRMQCM